MVQRRQEHLELRSLPSRRSPDRLLRRRRPRACSRRLPSRQGGVPPVLEELAVLLGIDLDPPAPPTDQTEAPPSPPDLDQQFEEVVQDLSDDEPPEDWDAGHDPLRVSKKVPTYREWRNLCPQEGTFWHEWIAFHEEYYGWVPPEYSMMVGALLIGWLVGITSTPRTEPKSRPAP